MRKTLTICVTTIAVSLSSAIRAHAQPATWPDPIANDVIPWHASGLTHGPLLGRITSSSVTVWLRTAEPVEFEILYSRTLPLNAQSTRVSGKVKAQADNIGVITLPKLMPATRYYYGVKINGALADLRTERDQPWPSFRTLPDQQTFHHAELNPRGLFNVCFAVGHCASQEPHKSGGQYASTPAYETLYQEHLDEVMFGIVNGDIIYEENRDGTLNGVRKNYQTYYSRGRSFQKLFRELPAVFTFDDHDVGWDLHGSGQVGLGEGPHLIRDIGLKAWEEYASWANYPGPQRGKVVLGQATLKAGDDVLFDANAKFRQLDPARVSTIHLGNYTSHQSPKRNAPAPPNAGVYRLKEVLDDQRIRIEPAPEEDGNVSYSIGTHHYYDWHVGNCHFLALDTRGERSERNRKNRGDKKIFILGETQRQWFMEKVQQSTADFIFVISPDPWTIYHTAAHVSKAVDADKDDKGDGFPSFTHERQLLVDFLDAIPKPVVIFTGDVHAAASVKLTDNVWEMMCGPLGSTGHPLATLGNPPRGGRWQSQGLPVEIRWVTGFPNNLPYQRIRNTCYGIVQVNNVLTVGDPEVAGYQHVAYDVPQVVVRWHDGYTGRLLYAESITLQDAIPR